MKMPEGDIAFVPLEKLKDYLLSETHPVGKAKAKLLRSSGFSEDNIDLLKQNMLAIARSEDVNDVIKSPHGVKYVIDGWVNTPSGGLLRVRTVWIVDIGLERPRFVTAYPLEKEG